MARLRSSGTERHGSGNGERTGVDLSRQVARSMREEPGHNRQGLVRATGAPMIADHVASPTVFPRRKW